MGLFCDTKIQEIVLQQIKYPYNKKHFVTWK